MISRWISLVPSYKPEQAHVAVDPLDGDVAHVTGAAVHLDGEIGNLAAISVQYSFAADGAILRSSPLIQSCAVSRTSARPPARPSAWSASIACTSWKFPMGVPP